MMGQTNWTSLCLKTLKVALWCTLTRYSWDATNLACLSIWVAIQCPYWQTDAWTYSFRAWHCPIMPIALFCYGEYRRSRSWNQAVGSKLFTQFKVPLVQFPLFLRGVAAGVVWEVGTWVIIIHKTTFDIKWKLLSHSISHHAPWVGIMMVFNNTAHSARNAHPQAKNRNFWT